MSLSSFSICSVSLPSSSPYFTTSHTEIYLRYRYHEYDWVGKAGDYVTETPGTIHTLYMGEGSEVIFDVMGSIEFYNEDNTLREIMDGFSFWRMYEEHCEKKGVEPNKGLWY